MPHNKIWVKILFGAAIFAVILLFAWRYFMSYRPEEIYMQSYPFILVDTQPERTRGLSGMEALSRDTVMLFKFDELQSCGIWMKDMRFSIDIIWLDDDFKIIKLKENVSPKTYPEVFSSSEPCRYVIEANAGFAKENSLAEGDEVIVDFKNAILSFK